MNRTLALIFAMATCFLLMFSCDTKEAAEKSDNSIDVVQARKEIEALDKQFSVYIQNKDSVALANMYTTNGSVGSTKGRENLVAFWGRMIRYGIENGTPRVNYISNAFTTDNEYVVELGTYQYQDTLGNTKSEGKYVVVWKKEDGAWKLHRDMGL